MRYCSPNVYEQRRDDDEAQYEIYLRSNNKYDLYFYAKSL